MVDMRRLHKNSTDQPKSSDLESDDVSRDQHTRFGSLSPLKLMGGFVVCLMGLSVLFSVSVIFKDFTIWDSAVVAHDGASRILDIEMMKCVLSDIVKNEFTTVQVELSC
ncbi:hypothetical protein Tco_1470437 [Tanacetum coccineum]